MVQEIMQRIFIFLYPLLACIFIMNPLIAIAHQDTQEAKNDLRILELLPNLLSPLAVDPGIPADFVALSPNGILDPHDFIYNKAIILEFKRAEKNKDVRKDADRALAQIIKKEYYTNIVECGVKEVVFIGIAFYGKRLEFRHQRMSVDKLKIKKMPGQETELTNVFLRS